MTYSLELWYYPSLLNDHSIHLSSSIEFKTSSPFQSVVLDVQFNAKYFSRLVLVIIVLIAPIFEEDETNCVFSVINTNGGPRSLLFSPPLFFFLSWKVGVYFSNLFCWLAALKNNFNLAKSESWFCVQIR